MKSKLAVVILSVILAAALAGCGGASRSVNSAASSAPAEKDLLAKVREKGKLTIAMEGTWAPWTYHDTDDKLVGYDVEVGQNIAKELGVEAEFIEGEWDGLLAGLDAGLYDILINGNNTVCIGFPERPLKGEHIGRIGSDRKYLT